ncbi:MAG TPA: hypothetical protein ACHBX0_12175 [Arsenophonus sp.]
MSNKIVIKNISQPILDKEILMLNSNQVDIQSGKIEGKTLLVNGNLSIDKAAIIKFDAVCINQIGNSGVVNRGELSARGGIMPIWREILLMSQALNSTSVIKVMIWIKVIN